MSDTKTLPVWPLSDPYFEGDSVQVLLDRFGDALGEAMGPRQAQRIAAVLGELADSEPASLLMMDAIFGAQRLNRVVCASYRDDDNLVAAAFYFGAAFAMASLEEEGVFDAAGRKAWLNARQSAGGSNRRVPDWHELAWSKARGLWDEAPERSPTDVADEVYAWLSTDAAWGQSKKSAPARADTVRRLIQKRRLAASA